MRLKEDSPWNDLKEEKLLREVTNEERIKLTDERIK